MGLVCCAVVHKGSFFLPLISIISILRLSEDIYNNTNEDSYNIFKHMVTI